VIAEPWIWRERSLAASAASWALMPAAYLYEAGQALRQATTRPVRISTPVICVGNATLGGVGKTPFALLLQQLLAAQGLKTHFLSRGYGGALAGPTQVGAEHSSAEVGDEPLLLARAAPTFVARNRIRGARAAAAGADIIIMDDGFQNPTIEKQCAFLLVNAADPTGNGRVFPAGPLRETLSRAAKRADALVLVGDGPAPAIADSPPMFRMRTMIAPSIAPQAVIAFCGIGGPERFFGDLERAGFTLKDKVAFPDHHPFTDHEIARLKTNAEKSGASLITTEKDLVRLRGEAHQGVAVAVLQASVDDPERLVALALSKCGKT
jgi:tetraacyldisaccharide 4'-kinase